MENKRHITYFCHQNRSGYAQSAQDYIYALRQSGNYDITMRLLHAKPDEISMTPRRYAEIIEMLGKESHSDSTQIIHGIPEKQIHLKLHAKSIGFATFETYDPPEHWVKILNQNKAVLVPSKFNKEIFTVSGVERPIFHIPHCIDPTLYHPDVPSIRVDDSFTFMFFGTWRKRKGWPQLIEAWFREFDASDKVNLLIKTDRITMANRAIEQIKASLGLKKDFAPISFETRILNEEAIPLLIKKADCLVCPTLGEGFGLPGLQAMALGVPIIITNYSGCQDYATAETATLIEPSGFIHLNELDMIPQFTQKRWCYLTAESVAKSMRYVVQNTEEVRKKAAAATSFVANEFSYKKTAERFDAMLDTI